MFIWQRLRCISLLEENTSGDLGEPWKIIEEDIVCFINATSLTNDSIKDKSILNSHHQALVFDQIQVLSLKPPPYFQGV